MEKRVILGVIAAAILGGACTGKSEETIGSDVDSVVDQGDSTTSLLDGGSLDAAVTSSNTAASVSMPAPEAPSASSSSFSKGPAVAASASPKKSSKNVTRLNARIAAYNARIAECNRYKKAPPTIPAPKCDKTACVEYSLSSCAWELKDQSVLSAEVTRPQVQVSNEEVSNAAERNARIAEYKARIAECNGYKRDPHTIPAPKCDKTACVEYSLSSCAWELKDQSVLSAKECGENPNTPVCEIRIQVENNPPPVECEELPDGGVNDSTCRPQLVGAER